MANYSHKTNIFFGSIFDPKGAKQAEQAINKIEGRITSLRNTYKIGTDGSRKLTQQIENISTTTQKSKTAFDELGMAMKRALIVAPVWMLMRNVMMSVFSAVGEGIGFWKETESALAQIAIASEATEGELKKLSDSVIGLSVILGVAATDGLKAAKIFAQQGLNIEETMAMTRTAMIGSKLLEQDVATVAENLTAAVRAYNIAFSDSISIIDMWMGVQRKYAVTAKDLADGMKTAGATASALGVSVQAFTGHLTAIIEVTRRSGSQAANALQMVYSRLLTQGGKVLETIGQVPIYLDQAGKATMQDTNIYRNTEEVMYDLSLRWKDLNENQKLNIALQVASRRQLTPFIALMDNYGRSLEAQIDALASAGESQRGVNILLATTESRIKQLQSSWLAFTSSLSKPGTSIWKGILWGASELIDTITFVVGKLEWYKKITREIAEEGLKNAESNKAQVASLKQLLEMKSSLEKTAQIVPEKYKKDVQDLIARVNLAVQGGLSEGAKLLPLPTSEEINKMLESKEKGQIRAQVVLDMSGMKAEIEKAESNLRDPLAFFQREEKSLELIGLSNEYQKQINEKTEERYQKSKQLTSQQQIQTDMEKLAGIRYEDANRELDNSIALLKMRGATEREILDFQIKQFETNSILLNGGENTNKLKELQLQKEREITQEQEKRLKLGNDEIKIYQISKKYGTSIAEDVAKAVKLQGNAIDQLSGQSLEVFKKEFSSLYENFQAQDFFKNEPSLKKWLSSYGKTSLSETMRGTGSPIKGTWAEPKIDNRIHLIIKVEN